MFGIDHSSTPPNPQKLVAEGVHFVGRYHSTPGNPKNLSPTEAVELLLAGLEIVSVFETTANRALKGHDAGVADARSADEQATAANVPGTDIYFAVDFDATLNDQTHINAYLLGAASVIGKPRVGVYGGYWVVKRALDAQVCRYAWQTYAWSGGQWDARAHLRQYLNGQHIAGIVADFDHSMQADFGQYKPPVVKKKKALLKAEKGYWAWVGWRLGEGDWAGYRPADPTVRPNVPKTVSQTWWKKLTAFLAARTK